MRSPAKLVVCVVCVIAVTAGAPMTLAQPIPRSLLRLCLRNIATGITCYIVGRGAELIVDGSLSAAWAAAKEKVTGETPEKEDKAEVERQRQLLALTKPPPSGPLSPFKNSIIEPIKPADLGPLSKRLPGSMANKALTGGFLIYEAPKSGPKPAIQPLGSTLKPGSTLTPSTFKSLILGPDPLGGAQTKHLLQEPLTTKLGSGKPKSFLPPNYSRARNAGKLAPPLASLTSGFGTLQEACQKRLERQTGLSFLAIVGRPDFDAKLKERMDKVVKPCILPSQH